MLAGRDEAIALLRKNGVSADLIEKMLVCYDYLAGGGMGKTLTATSHLIYYVQQAEREMSAVAALDYLVADE